MRSDRRRVVVKRLQVSYAESERHVCKALNFPRASHRYQSVRDERAELRIRLRDLASTRVDFGYRRLHIFLLREGWKVNHKLVYRLYIEEGLQMRRKRPRRNRSCQVRVTRPKASCTNESWSMDFMSDQLFDGKRFRLLTLVDNFSRESLAIRVGTRMTGDDVVAALERVKEVRGCPQSIRVDNGPEFISKSLWNAPKSWSSVMRVRVRLVNQQCDAGVEGEREPEAESLPERKRHTATQIWRVSDRLKNCVDDVGCTYFATRQSRSSLQKSL